MPDRSRSPRGHGDAELILGGPIATELCAQVLQGSRELQDRHNVIPGFAVIEVGDHQYGALLEPMSDVATGPVPLGQINLPHQNYAELKARMAERCGMRSQVLRFSQNVSQEQLMQTISQLVKDPSVHGILLEMPLPPHLDERHLLASIPPWKDAEGFNAHNLGLLHCRWEPKTRPAVAAGILELLFRSNVPMVGKHAVVLGRSRTVGWHIAALLMDQDCTVTVCHSQTPDIPEVVKRADILVACVGRPGFVRGSWLKPGCVVVDAGMNVVSDGKSAASVVGDVCFEEACKVASKITPVPGGVGNSSFAILLRNVLNLARQSLRLTKIGVGPAGPERFRCADTFSFPDIALQVPTVMLPRKGADLTKWSVVACDQYTSQPEYWKSVQDKVGTSPSTLNLIFPEVYLSDDKTNRQIIQGIRDRMYEYDRDGILQAQAPGFVLIDRKTPSVESRKGLVVAIDLEQYDFSRDSQSLIRPTEKTIEDRLPPRMAIREKSSLELPHILMLIDDPDRTVIEPLFAMRDTLEVLYDCELMKDSGHLKGYHVGSRDAVEGVVAALRKLADPARFRERTGAKSSAQPILYAAGDGNHSLATAKRCWEALKRAGAHHTHPARHALVELVNVYDEGMNFEPIHRLVFNVDGEAAIQDFVGFCGEQGWGPARVEWSKVEATGRQHVLHFCVKGKQGTVVVENPGLVLPVATLTTWLDAYGAGHKGVVVDYVHGDEVVHEKTAGPDCLGFLLPGMEKGDLIRTVVKEGVLPKKTFSMGTSDEKRFYFEARRIVNEPAFFKADFFRRGQVSGPLRPASK